MPKKTPPPEDLEDDDDLEDDETDDDTGDGDVTDERIAGVVRDVLAEAGLLTGKKAAGKKAAAKPDDEPGRPRNARDEEDATEDRVRRAVAKIKEEESVKDRIAKVEKAVEKPPKPKPRRLTRALWGSDDDE